MACEHWNDDWVADLYGELSPDEARVLREHLDRCAECRSALRSLNASRDLVRQAMPEVPPVPRVVVLRPRPAWSSAWTFAAGAACALLLFAGGFVAGPRWNRAAGVAADAAVAAQPTPARQAAGPDDAVDGPIEAQATSGTLGVLRDEVLALAARLDRLESRPDDETRAVSLFNDELEGLEQRIAAERVRDLEYVMRTITASELRTGTWMDRTRDALTLLALRQDPTLAER